MILLSTIHIAAAAVSISKARELKQVSFLSASYVKLCSSKDPLLDSNSATQLNLCEFLELK